MILYPARQAKTRRRVLRLQQKAQKVDNFNFDSLRKIDYGPKGNIVKAYKELQYNTVSSQYADLYHRLSTAVIHRIDVICNTKRTMDAIDRNVIDVAASILKYEKLPDHLNGKLRVYHLTGLDKIFC